MKWKDYLLPLGLALVTIWGLQYFVLNRFMPQASQVDGRGFIAPAQKQEYKPLYLEVDFLDMKRPARAVETEVETEWGDLVFSTDGACLERLEFKRHINGKDRLLGTIFPGCSLERDEKCFLVAFDQSTPYYYQLIEKKDGKDSVELTYQVDLANSTIQKKFLVDKKIHKIDLFLEIVPNNSLDKAIEPRIIFPAPCMPSIEKTDIKSAVVVDSQDVFEKIAREKLEVQRGWFSPQIFGTDNRYFVHALVKDDNKFVQRAYYKFADKSGLYSILEGPAVSEKTSWVCSFYFGPKDTDAIVQVDERLTNTLDFSGIFAPISRFVLYMLKWLYKYFGNYGAAIIVLTLGLRLLLLPFSLGEHKSQRQRDDLQKKMKYIQQKYKHDPEKLRLEQAELVKKYGMPGLSGCLPLLVQMPFFFVLSRVLNSSIELYQAPMLWISDLSAADPYYILPVLIFLSMLGLALTVESQQRITMFVAAVCFGAFSINFSAGLALYICISNLLVVGQKGIAKAFSQA